MRNFPRIDNAARTFMTGLNAGLLWAKTSLDRAKQKLDRATSLQEFCGSKTPVI